MSTFLIRLILSLLVFAVAGGLWVTGHLTEPTEAIITWSTESEVETAGFHVYRATNEAGPYTRVSEALIPSSGDPFTGARYEFRDPTVELGNTYFYQLEELETSGQFTRLDEMVRFDASLTPNWPVAFGLLVALFLIWLPPDPAWFKKATPTQEVA